MALNKGKLAGITALIFVAFATVERGGPRWRILGSPASGSRTTRHLCFSGVALHLAWVRGDARYLSQ
ncbi:MAG: hypothetical protein WC450_07975 [Candidatus Omnitrophota bacterium]